MPGGLSSPSDICSTPTLDGSSMRLHTLLSTLFVGSFSTLAAGFAADSAIAPVDPALGRPVEFYVDVFPILEAVLNLLVSANRLKI